MTVYNWIKEQYTCFYNNLISSEIPITHQLKKNLYMQFSVLQAISKGY